MSEEDRLDSLRREIASLDEQLVSLLARRLELVEEVGVVKQELGLPTLDPTREAEVVRRGAELARARGLDPELARDVLWRIMAHARFIQDTRGRR
jgi:chorismate mutase/prephenate dehydrogenase